MIIPASRWFGAIKTRRSRRTFNNIPVSPDTLSRLNMVCTEFKPFPHARAVLVNESPKRLFKGVIGPYGKIRGAPAFVAFIGNMNSPNVQEGVGYLGEGIILEAEAMHLATCWVGGFFRQEVVTEIIDINESEKVLAITPVGYAVEHYSMEERFMTGFGWTHRRKHISAMVTGLNEADWSEWINAALGAARLAPSATNRQPWRFGVESGSITVLVNQPGMEFNVAKRLDCGITMLHIEVAALNYGKKGRWEFLEAPQVARFDIGYNE